MFEVTDTVQEIVRAIGARVEALRLSRGLTQAELAKRCAVSKHTIERIESGNGNPRLEGLIAVCQVVGSVKGFERVLPDVELTPSDILAGRALPKRARKAAQKKIIWGDEQ